MLAEKSTGMILPRNGLPEDIFAIKFVFLDRGHDASRLLQPLAGSVMLSVTGALTRIAAGHRDRWD